MEEPHRIHKEPTWGWAGALVEAYLSNRDALRSGAVATLCHAYDKNQPLQVAQAVQRKP